VTMRSKVAAGVGCCVLIAATPSSGAEDAAVAALPAKVAIGIWCDQAEQTEALAKSHFARGLTVVEATRQTNEAAQNPTACIVAAAYVVEGDEVRRFIAGTRLLSIRPYRVLGAVKSGFLIRFTPQTWFGVRVVATLTRS
jgi:hypothetical protein